MITTPRVGCLGLGNMGAGMARNILGAGFDVTVFDVRAEPVERFRGLGAKTATTPAELAANVDIVTVCVLNDAQVEGVLLGQDGVLASLRAGGVIVVHSTASPAVCQRMSEEAAPHSVKIVDAPISGGEGAANDGTLTLMIGGDDNAVEACSGVFDAISATRFHVGPTGAGQVAKVVNNLMGIVNRIVVGEGLSLSRAVGIDDDTMLEVVRSSSGNSWQVEMWRQMQQIAAQSTTGAEGMSLMGKKDLAIALAIAEGANVSLPITQVAHGHTGAMFTAVG